MNVTLFLYFESGEKRSSHTHELPDDGIIQIFEFHMSPEVSGYLVEL